MAYENIIVETRESVGLITLNRPNVLNALSTPSGPRAGRGAGRVRSRLGDRRGGADRLGKGLRGGRRHQGDAVQELARHL